MDEELLLDAHEARVFGVLVEKSLTTPEQYPLSLNAATAGCNQKSNRFPVLDLAESTVLVALDKLVVRGLAGRVHPAGSRVERFRHNGSERLKMSDAEIAVLAELLMRGPQTPGDLRARASRMAQMESQEDLQRVLAPLMQRGFVERLAPAPGSRAERYAQLMSPDLHPLEASAAPAAAPRMVDGGASMPLIARVEALEREIATLRAQLHNLAETLGEELEG